MGGGKVFVEFFPNQLILSKSNTGIKCDLFHALRQEMENHVLPNVSKWPVLSGVQWELQVTLVRTDTIKKHLLRFSGIIWWHQRKALPKSGSIAQTFLWGSLKGWVSQLTHKGMAVWAKKAGTPSEAGIPVQGTVTKGGTHRVGPEHLLMELPKSHSAQGSIACLCSSL